MRRSSWSWLGAVLVLGFVTGAPSRAFAGDTSAAEGLFEEGMKALKREDWKAACDAFAGSNEADPSPGTEINLALCSEKQGKFATAWGWYRTASGLAEQRGQRERAERARNEAARIEPQVNKIKITTKDSPQAVTVTRDGVGVPAAYIGREAPIDPGAHVIEVTGKGKKPWRSEITIAAGTKVTPLDVPSLEDEPKDEPAVVGGSVGPDVARGRDGTTQRNIGFVVGGAGIVAGAAAIGLEIFALGQDSKRKDQEELRDRALAENNTVNAGEYQKAADSFHDAAKGNELAAIITGATGVALLGVGIALVVTANSHGSSTSALAKPMVVPFFGNGTTGVGFVSAF